MCVLDYNKKILEKHKAEEVRKSLVGILDKAKELFVFVGRYSWVGNIACGVGFKSVLPQFGGRKENIKMGRKFCYLT